MGFPCNDECELSLPQGMEASLAGTGAGLKSPRQVRFEVIKLEPRPERDDPRTIQPVQCFPTLDAERRHEAHILSGIFAVYTLSCSTVGAGSCQAYRVEREE